MRPFLLDKSYTVNLHEYVPSWEAGSVRVPVLGMNLISARVAKGDIRSPVSMPQLDVSGNDAVDAYSVSVPLENFAPAEAHALIEGHAVALWRRMLAQRAQEAAEVPEDVPGAAQAPARENSEAASDMVWKFIRGETGRRPLASEESDVAAGHVFDPAVSEAGEAYPRELLFGNLPGGSARWNAVRFKIEPENGAVVLEVRQKDASVTVRVDGGGLPGVGRVRTENYRFWLSNADAVAFFRKLAGAMPPSADAALREGAAFFSDPQAFAGGVWPEKALLAAAHLTFAEQFGAMMADKPARFHHAFFFETGGAERLPRREWVAGETGVAAVSAVTGRQNVETLNVDFSSQTLVEVRQRADGSVTLVVARPELLKDDRMPLEGALLKLAREMQK